MPRQPSLLGELLSHRDIAVRNLPQEHSVRPVQHDVEVLHCMHALQTLPILEPDQLFYLWSERLLYVITDLFLGFCGREPSVGVVVPYLALVIVLLWRPQGLAGKRVS